MKLANYLYKFFIIIGFIIIFFIPTKYADAFITDSITEGISVPSNYPIDSHVKVINKTIYEHNLNGRYLLFNNNPYEYKSLEVGDKLKITNIYTGKSFLYDTNCGVNKLHSMDLTYLVESDDFDEYGAQYLKFEFINKCTQSKFIGPLYLYYKDISDPFPFPSLYTDFKQTDPLWGSNRLNNNSSCGTLYGYGCAVTSVADVFSSYGKTALANSSVILNPGTLNNWLAQHGGFSVCSIYWGAAASSVKLGPPELKGRGGSSEWLVGKQAIDNALANGNLVILGVKTNNNDVGTHFLVVSEKLADVNGKPDYKLIDPALYPFTPNNPGNTGKPLSQVYGGFDNVFQYVIYKKDSAPKNTLAIGGHSPIQLVITDPFGNKTGFDGDTGEITENIPGSSYVVEPGIEPVDKSEPSAYGKKYFQQVEPSIGSYTVEVKGTGNGEYTLGFSKTDEEGKVSITEMHGFAEQGITEIYQIENMLDASIPVLIDKNVTFQSLNDDVSKLFSANLITQKSVSNSLIRNIEQAENAANANDLNKVVQNLDQFVSILERERGRKITESAYLILKDNVNFLRGKYQN